MSRLTDSVEKGSRDRAAMLRKFGFIPLSIVKLSRGALHRSLFHLPAERATGRVRGSESLARVDAAKTEAGRLRSEERRAAGMLGAVREYAEQHDRTSVSVMAAELVDFFVRYYGRPGAVYLDPFAGHGVRLQVAQRRGMSYLGMDACAEYVAYIERVIERLPVDEKLRLEVRRGDSRDPSWVDDGIGDFCLTSPPYWDVEFYGPEPEQLGTGKTYAEFLAGMEDVARAWLPKFKTGAWVIVNVNDLRRDTHFIPYHADVIALYQRAGYVMHDLWVIEGLIAGLPKAFAVSFNMQRIAPKVHEFCLVFRVP